jgi:CheY-like chemotaxis protein
MCSDFHAGKTDRRRRCATSACLIFKQIENPPRHAHFLTVMSGRGYTCSPKYDIETGAYAVHSSHSPVYSDFVPDVTNTTSKRVLIVEDNLDSAHTLTFLLRQSGHQVEFAINGYAALAVAERWVPDLVFLDIGLPDFDGCTLVRRMRRLPNLAQARFIAITGRVSDDDEQRARAAGCEQFLRKPVMPQVVEGIISAAPPSANTAAASIRPQRGI